MLLLSRLDGCWFLRCIYCILLSIHTYIHLQLHLQIIELGYYGDENTCLHSYSFTQSE